MKEDNTMVKKIEVTDYKYELRNMADENIAIVYLINKNDLICMSVFHDSDDEDLPPPREGLNGVVYVACKFNWLKNIIDMLRNEKPVFFLWHRENQIATLSTENENVGDEERNSLLKFIFG